MAKNSEMHFFYTDLLVLLRSNLCGSGPLQQFGGSFTMQQKCSIGPQSEIGMNSSESSTGPAPLPAAKEIGAPPQGGVGVVAEGAAVHHQHGPVGGGLAVPSKPRGGLFKKPPGGLKLHLTLKG